MPTLVPCTKVNSKGPPERFSPDCVFPKLKNSALGVVWLYIVYIVFISVVNMNDMAFAIWMCGVFDVMSFV